MSELAQGSISFLAILLTAVSAWIQMRGGRPGGRIYYRLIFPLFFSFSILFIALLSGNFKTAYLLFVPYYLLVTHLGHTKFHERLFECIAYTLPGVLYVYFYTDMCTFWTSLMLLMSTGAAVIGHFFNQKTAPRAEFIVNFLRVALIPYMVS